MEKKQIIPTELLDGFHSLLRRCLFQVLSVGPMPRHVAFILDGNRRYSRKYNLSGQEGYQAGFFNIMSILRYCCEMRISCVTLYGFSIDNFNRNPTDLQQVMDLIQEKLQALLDNAGLINELGIRVEFLGNLGMLKEAIREGAKRAMAATATNGRLVVLVCLAYSSTDEIARGVTGACVEVWARGSQDGGSSAVSVADLERRMMFAGHRQPDILIRTSGETRLSNFMLWQTSFCLLYAPRCLWPELSLWHIVWAVLEYQRKHGYLEKIKKQA